jgi:hypothetical protein
MPLKRVNPGLRFVFLHMGASCVVKQIFIPDLLVLGAFCH